MPHWAIQTRSLADRSKIHKKKNTAGDADKNAPLLSPDDPGNVLWTSAEDHVREKADVLTEQQSGSTDDGHIRFPGLKRRPFRLFFFSRPQLRRSSFRFRERSCETVRMDVPPLRCGHVKSVKYWPLTFELVPSAIVALFSIFLFFCFGISFHPL